MIEGERIGVQGDALVRERRLRPVAQVPQQGPAQAGAGHPQLVGSPGLGEELQEGRTLPLDGAPAGAGLPRPGGVGPDPPGCGSAGERPRRRQRSSIVS